MGHLAKGDLRRRFVAGHRGGQPLFAGAHVGRPAAPVEDRQRHAQHAGPAAVAAAEQGRQLLADAAGQRRERNGRQHRGLGRAHAGVGGLDARIGREQVGPALQQARRQPGRDLRRGALGPGPRAARLGRHGAPDQHVEPLQVLRDTHAVFLLPHARGLQQRLHPVHVQLRGAAHGAGATDRVGIGVQRGLVGLGQREQGAVGAQREVGVRDLAHQVHARGRVVLVAGLGERAALLRGALLPAEEIELVRHHARLHVEAVGHAPVRRQVADRAERALRRGLRALGMRRQAQRREQRSAVARIVRARLAGLRGIGAQVAVLLERGGDQAAQLLVLHEAAPVHGLRARCRRARRPLRRHRQVGVLELRREVAPGRHQHDAHGQHREEQAQRQPRKARARCAHARTREQRRRRLPGPHLHGHVARRHVEDMAHEVFALRLGGGELQLGARPAARGEVGRQPAHRLDMHLQRLPDAQALERPPAFEQRAVGRDVDEARLALARRRAHPCPRTPGKALFLLRARQVDAGHERTQAQHQRDAGPHEVELVARRERLAAQGRHRGRTLQRHQQAAEDGHQLPVHHRARAVQPLGRHLERMAEGLQHRARQRAAHGHRRHQLAHLAEHGQAAALADPVAVGPEHHERRQAVGRKGLRRGMEGRDAGIPVQRRRQQHQHHEGLAQPVQQPVQEVHPRRQAVARAAQGPVGQQRELHGAQAPAAALVDVVDDALGRQPVGQPLAQPARDAAVAQQQVGGVDVFAHAADREPAGLGDRVAPHDERGAHAERRIDRVLGRLQHVEEHALLVDPAVGGAQVVLDGVGVVIELRRLHQPHAAVLEQAEHAVDDLALRREVGVEHEDERRVGHARGQAQAVVEVAGLGVAVVGPPRVMHAAALAVRAQPVAPRVVEHPDVQPRVVDGLRGDDGFLEHGQLFVVGADEDIDGRHLLATRMAFAQRGLAPVGLRAVVAAPHEHVDRHQRVDDGREFEAQEHPGEQGFEAQVRGRHRGDHAPDGVAQQEQRGERAEQHAVGDALDPGPGHEEQGEPPDQGVELEFRCGDQAGHEGTSDAAVLPVKGLKPVAARAIQAVAPRCGQR
ncbi:hypothetical protein D9M72_237180 [compost metagenome]